MNRIKSRLEEGTLGAWKIERFVVPKDSIAALRFAMAGRNIPPGEYTRLTRNGAVIMSDTPAEVNDLLGFFRAATGRILINGLGLAVGLLEILKKETVTHVDVIEVDIDVINLVGSQIKDDRVIIHHANALEWKPSKGQHWDVVWHDIWDDISMDNLDMMKKLHRKYGRHCSWQRSWCRDRCEYIRKKEKAWSASRW